MFFFEIPVKMSKAFRARRQEVYLRVSPEFADRILISSNANETESSGGIRYRRRTTSFKSRKTAEMRRASVPALYKLNIKQKASRKSLIQKIGSRLAKLGDELVRRNDMYRAHKFHQNCPDNIRQYARHLAEIGDCLNALYSSQGSPMYSESDRTSLAENCLALTSILTSLKNNNVVVINSSDICALSSICRLHWVKCMQRVKK